LNFFEKLNTVLKDQNKKVWLGFDPVHQLASSGNWYKSQKEDIDAFLKTATFESSNNAINIDSRLYQNAGGLIIQQLAYSLAHLNEYLNILDNSDSKLTAVKGQPSNLSRFQLLF